VQYQDLDYSARYEKLVEEIKQAEMRRIGDAQLGATTGKGVSNKEGSARAPGLALTEAVALNYFKLLAYKDEYEVARLHSDPAFLAKVAEQFEGDYKLRFHLAPPILSRVDPKTGKPRKLSFGPWMMTGFKLLKRMKILRGRAVDVFGQSDERKQERALIAQYEQCLEQVIKHLDVSNYALAIELAKVPEQVRGFGHVKEPAMKTARAELTRLLSQIQNPGLMGSSESAKIITLSRPNMLARK
jgi:indolepyruvate ferredoxin oxidoreductase